MNRTNHATELNELKKENTRKALLDGIKVLSREKKHETKPITKYELYQYTGISRPTINRYQDVLDKLNEVNAKISKTNASEQACLNLDSVSSFDEAKALLDTLLVEYNNKCKECDEYKQLLTQRDLEIAKLRSNVTELKNYLKFSEK